MTISKEKAFELKNAGYPQPIEPVFGQKYWHEQYGELCYLHRNSEFAETKFYAFYIKDHFQSFVLLTMQDLIESAAFAPTPTEIMEQLPKEVDGVICLFVLRLYSGGWYLETNLSPAIFKGENPADICADAYLYFKRIFKRPYIDILKDDIEKPKMQ